MPRLWTLWTGYWLVDSGTCRGTIVLLVGGRNHNVLVRYSSLAVLGSKFDCVEALQRAALRFAGSTDEHIFLKRVQTAALQGGHGPGTGPSVDCD